MRKMNFKNWRIVDVDHYMKGNSFFQKQMTEGEYKTQFEKIMGDQKERRVKIADPKEIKSFE
jgi:hypothetical protein